MIENKRVKKKKTTLIFLGIRPELRNLFLIYFKKRTWKCLTQNGQRHKGRGCLGYLLRGLILSGPFSSSLINTDTPGRLQVLALDSKETKVQLRTHRFKFTAQFQGLFGLCLEVSLVGFGISVVSLDVAFYLSVQVEAHWIMELLRLGKTSKDIKSSTTSTHFWNFPRDGDYTTHSRVSQPFPWRNFPQYSNLSLSWGNSRPFPLILTLFPGKDSPWLHPSGMFSIILPLRVAVPTGPVHRLDVKIVLCGCEEFMLQKLTLGVVLPGVGGTMGITKSIPKTSKTQAKVAGMVGFGWRLDLRILEVFSKLFDFIEGSKSSTASAVPPSEQWKFKTIPALDGSSGKGIPEVFSLVFINAFINKHPKSSATVCQAQWLLTAPSPRAGIWESSLLLSEPQTNELRDSGGIKQGKTTTARATDPGIPAMELREHLLQCWVKFLPSLWNPSLTLPLKNGVRCFRQLNSKNNRGKKKKKDLQLKSSQIINVVLCMPDQIQLNAFGSLFYSI